MNSGSFPSTGGPSVSTANPCPCKLSARSRRNGQGIPEGLKRSEPGLSIQATGNRQQATAEFRASGDRKKGSNLCPVPCDLFPEDLTFALRGRQTTDSHFPRDSPIIQSRI